MAITRFFSENPASIQTRSSPQFSNASMDPRVATSNIEADMQADQILSQSREEATRSVMDGLDKQDKLATRKSNMDMEVLANKLAQDRSIPLDKKLQALDAFSASNMGNFNTPYAKQTFEMSGAEMRQKVTDVVTIAAAADAAKLYRASARTSLANYGGMVEQNPAMSGQIRASGEAMIQGFINQGATPEQAATMRKSLTDSIRQGTVRAEGRSPNAVHKGLTNQYADKELSRDIVKASSDNISASIKLEAKREEVKLKEANKGFFARTAEAITNAGIRFSEKISHSGLFYSAADVKEAMNKSNMTLTVDAREKKANTDFKVLSNYVGKVGKVTYLKAGKLPAMAEIGLTNKITFAEDESVQVFFGGEQLVGYTDQALMAYSREGIDSDTKGIMDAQFKKAGFDTQPKVDAAIKRVLTLNDAMVGRIASVHGLDKGDVKSKAFKNFGVGITYSVKDLRAFGFKIDVGKPDPKRYVEDAMGFWVEKELSVPRSGDLYQPLDGEGIPEGVQKPTEDEFTNQQIALTTTTLRDKAALEKKLKKDKKGRKGKVFIPSTIGRI